MAICFIPIDHYKTKFYQKENQTKYFQELSEEQLAAVAKKLYKRQEIIQETRIYGTANSTKLNYYQRILQYLTHPSIHMEIATFDERLAFLIMAVDPNLITFKEFLKINLQSIDEITLEPNLKIRNKLFDQRNETLNKYENTVREQIGFFDAKLLKYEELFFKKFYSKRELITEVKQRNEDNLMSLEKYLESFKSISDKRYDELIEKAQLWLTLVPDKYKTKIATYSVTNQKKLIGLNSLAEQFAFFILVVDPNLDMLRIYEEESMIPKMAERIIEEFGFYHPSLLSLEEKYHSRFCPNKKISIWSETK